MPFLSQCLFVLLVQKSAILRQLFYPNKKLFAQTELPMYPFQRLPKSSLKAKNIFSQVLLETRGTL